MTFNNTFKGIIFDIEEYGDTSQPRDMKVRELTIDQRCFDPTRTIANFENRKFNWKYFAGELAWYLNRDRDVDYIGNFSNFWSYITNPGTNEINSNYGSLLFGEQLQWALDSLKADKNTRQSIAFLNQPKFQFEGNKDFVCTMYANFFIRNNALHMKIQMRSNDIFYGLTFDAPFFSFLQQSVYLKLKETYPDLELGMYYHYADNLHFYERHFDLASEIRFEEIKPADEFTFILKEPFLGYDGEKVFLTDTAITFIKEIDDSIDNAEISTKEDYKAILDKYFVTNGE